jgi:hypothetical protein
MINWIKPITKTFVHHNFKFILEITSEKPFQKKNLGSVFVVASFYHSKNYEWKNISYEKNKYYLPEPFFRKILNVKKLDLRDLCLKRGKVTKNLKLTVFFDENIKFDFINFFYNYSFNGIKKDLILKKWKIYINKYTWINEKAVTKGFIKDNSFSLEITKIKYKKFKKSQVFRGFNQSVEKIGFKWKKNFFIIHDFSNQKNKNSNLIFCILKKCFKKKKILLKVS